MINFGAGPAKLPEPVLHHIQNNFFNWQNTGVSILELGHRTVEFASLGERLEALVRRLLKVPNDFSILFLPGGAQIQFAMVAMNLLGHAKTVNYLETGHWSASAIKEAKKYAEVHIAASSREQQFRTIPDRETWDINPQGAYLHFTDNETIGGLEFNNIPAVNEMMLVSDMSSNLFSRPIDFARIGAVYACAQKNLGIAGMSVVIVRNDLLDQALPSTPDVFNYRVQRKNNSMLCTPTTFAWYVAVLVLEWLEQQGGVEAIARVNNEKARRLYDYLDNNGFYENFIDPRYRSRMNVPFILKNAELEKAFFKAAEENGLLYLQGHRSVGGARASIYNAMTLEEVNQLIQFLKQFARDNA
ncbi:phosphoserine aminotransferase [Legionella birminghamensis]|uniref:Phosphoserine aminotransferase n=1 Tax=Legionella birminghamensis TaxID=28083 RepID=A0A378I6T6_9GAMM|nr:3-phosphoserine/phosphohydroxythreonine transaminase [Legionella birminghamensis]KTC71513.1 phosphoserine aminotransferase [Legionella birminghamensis]STX30879.1 phosphoserine aminotransferase [Legionella birminghamensis]